MSTPTVHSIQDGEIGVWLEENGSICLAAKSAYGDPVELSVQAARSLAHLLIRLVEHVPDQSRRYYDPVTGMERLRIDKAHVDPRTGRAFRHPKACVPHAHGWDRQGRKLRDALANDHQFPLKSGT